MIIPLAHDDLAARRVPIVTLVLAAACFLVFLWSGVAGRRVEGRVESLAREAIDVASRHRSVKLCPTLARVARVPSRAEPPRGDAGQAAAAQVQVDGLCAQIDGLVKTHPVHRFGYVPAGNGALGLLTHMFLHGGWLHLLFNLWFFALCGMNLEDRWGRAVFLPFYLLAGVVAAWIHGVATSGSTVPMIGASGAVAGAMGAFLVCFATTRIRFFYWFGWRFGTFRAPAYLMLPLWIATEVLEAVLIGSADGVAHWSHVGGFAFGAAFAAAVRATGMERRLDEAVERAVTVSQDARILRAAELADAGRPIEAFALLDEVAREQPANLDVHLEGLRAAKLAGERARELAAYARLVDLYLQQGNANVAADLFEEAARLGIAEGLPRSSGLLVAADLVASGELRRARAVYAVACHEGLVDVVAARATFARARVAASLGMHGEARALFDEVIGSPVATDDLRALATGERAKLPDAIALDL
jgi:membrane associated rhomboid family serine protease